MLLLLFRRARKTRARFTLSDRAVWVIATADQAAAFITVSDKTVIGLAVGDAP